MQIDKVKNWKTEVVCQRCGSNIQHYPIYVPNSRTIPDKENPGFMSPPSFMKFCIPCLRHILDDLEKAYKEGKLFPIQLWKEMKIDEAVYIMDDGSEKKASEVFPEEFKKES